VSLKDTRSLGEDSELESLHFQLSDLSKTMHSTVSTKIITYI
jgi:hypothetical protein